MGVRIDPAHFIEIAVRRDRTGRSFLSDLVESLAGKRKLSGSFSRGFLLVALVILLGQVLIVNLAGDFFEVAPLSAQDWGLLFLATSPVLLIPELFRTVRHVRRVRRNA